MRGSISKHTGRDGTVSWHVRVDTVDSATGKRRQPQRTYRTKREAEAGLQEWLTEIAAGTGTRRSTQTVAEYLAWWLDSCVAHRVKPSTLASYRALSRAYIVPELGALPLQQLGAQALQGFYARCLSGAFGGRGAAGGQTGAQAKRRGPLAPGSVRQIHTVLHAALAEALRLGLVARNVADAARAPRMPEQEATAWTAEELRRFLEVARGDAYWPLWLIAAHTGLRQSEVFGVRWRDVDLDAGRLTVAQSLVRVGSSTQMQPGAKAGGHTLALDAPSVEALRAWRPAQREQRLQLGPLWQGQSGSDLVFTGALGAPIHPSTAGRHFRALVEQAGVTALTLHGLRHTHATLLMLAGVHPKIVSERLGHADVGITLRIYSHVLPRMDQQAADTFAALLTERCVSEGAHDPEQELPS